MKSVRTMSAVALYRAKSGARFAEEMDHPTGINQSTTQFAQLA
jgi:hypothetical protein